MTTNIPQAGGQNLLNPMLAQQQSQGLRIQQNNAQVIPPQQMGTPVQMGNVNILPPQSNQMPQLPPNPQLIQTTPFLASHAQPQPNQAMRPINVNMQPFVQPALIPSSPQLASGAVPIATIPVSHNQIQPRPPQPQVTEFTDIVSRQKLQEIVSQIDNKEKLDPDAEELLIMIAEEFVESVTQFACMLAKHRNSSTLEVRDLQLHLERNWNIKIPGFGSEETKPVRKQPVNENHKQRLNAVRKAKK